jgi:hypothetical protein
MNIVLSIESLGFFGLLENSQNNSSVNRFLEKKSDKRKIIFNKLIQMETFNLEFPRFKKIKFKKIASEDLMVSFREETFYSLNCKIEAIIGFFIVIRFISLKKGKSNEKIYVLPHDHPRLLYFSK